MSRAAVQPRTANLNARDNLRERFMNMDRRSATRLALFAVIVVSLLLAMLFTLNGARAIDAPIARTSASATVATGPQTLEQFASIWRANVVRSAEQITINWTAGNAFELRASLLAFDAVQVKSPRISVSRRDANFAISVEASP